MTEHVQRADVRCATCGTCDVRRATCSCDVQRAINRRGDGIKAGGADGGRRKAEGGK